MPATLKNASCSCVSLVPKRYGIWLFVCTLYRGESQVKNDGAFGPQGSETVRMVFCEPCIA